MTERELKLLLDANAIKRIQLHYAVMVSISITSLIYHLGADNLIWWELQPCI